jgi:hypothetical protein
LELRVYVKALVWHNSDGFLGDAVWGSFH